MKLELLLIAHIFGDYIFQPHKLVRLKEESYLWVIFHCLIYALVFTVFSIFFGAWWQIILTGAVAFASHCIMDCAKKYILDRFSRKPVADTAKIDLLMFAVDQLYHIGIIIAMVHFFTGINAVGSFFQNIDHNFAQYLKYILCLLIVWYPVSVLVKHALNATGVTNDDNPSNKLGALIGRLERCIILILGFMGLYASVAIVLTAKTVARFPSFKEEKFAEKFLIGTLLSVGCALAALFLFAKL